MLKNAVCLHLPCLHLLKILGKVSVTDSCQHLQLASHSKNHDFTLIAFDVRTDQAENMANPSWSVSVTLNMAKTVM